MTEIAMPEKAETKESGGKKKGAKKGGRST
ncbi:MAG: hypothetical protein ACJAZ8_000371, partial [Planctomycetota bacterium]